MKDSLDIDVLITMSKDGLLEALGGDGGLFASPAGKRIRGLRIFKDAVQQKKVDICNTSFIKQIQNEPRVQIRVQAIAAIFDFLGTAGGAIAAVLLLQVGIDKICSGEWENEI